MAQEVAVSTYVHTRTRASVYVDMDMGIDIASKVRSTQDGGGAREIDALLAWLWTGDQRR